MTEEQQAPQQPPADNRPAPTVSAVSVKIPPFWPANPQVWFAQVEAQFATWNITAQRTCFDYIVALLAPEFAIEIRDLLLSPPEDRPYDTLKTQLIQRTAASKQRRLQQLLTTEELGDRKPFTATPPDAATPRRFRRSQLCQFFFTGTLASASPQPCPHGFSFVR